MILLGAFLAGLVLTLKDLIPWLQAQASGSIRTRGHKRQTVRRRDDPERFRTLSRNRLKSAWLGVILLNSNAEAHFSFTNALGLVAEEDMQALLAATRAFPQARWILALHHHPVEYPRPAKAFSERIGTALINGSRLLRLLRPVASRMVAMHGHRHIDWIGRCGALKIISAPSPVMEATDAEPTCFYIHTLAAASDGVALLEPQRIVIEPAPPAVKA